MGAGGAAGPGLSVGLGRAGCAIGAESGAVCKWAPSALQRGTRDSI